MKVRHIMFSGDIGHEVIVWTVRLSVAAYCCAVWRHLFARNDAASPNGDAVVRLTWSMAWLLCVIHVICAFHFQHHWNHIAALKHTAEMTDRVVGIYWSGGLYINYAFLVWWGWDVWRMLKRDDSHRSGVAIQAVAAFMMFNATVVFGPGWWMIVFGAFATAVGWTTWRRTSP